MRNKKKKALYEAISDARSKTRYEQLHQVYTPSEASGNEQNPTPSVIKWVRKPRLIQFYEGRLEFSMPYQVAIAVLLGAILVMILAFRLGERIGARPANASAGQPTPGKPAEQSPRAAESLAARTNSPSQPVSSGANRIVIQMFQVRAHLEPVKEYFDKLGVETEIVERNNWYYLVTKNKYNNPDKQGTDGFAAKQKIVELGAGYKAPAGFETFGAKPFSGAFGMKFEE
ncbi:MAG: hypothetical protein JW749_08615 [Sedimentisphaerales bacterium]|nr:hypothetical protein [Sedimentisphaerales bacterium]